MTGSLRKTLTILPLITLIAACQSEEQMRVKRAEELRSRAIESIAEKIVYYNANVEWLRKFKVGDFLLNTVLSIELKKALMGNQQPAFFITEIVDLSEDKGIYTAIFVTAFETYSDIFLYLNCDSSMANGILTQEREYSSRFAIFTELNHVEKFEFNLHSSGNGEDSTWIWAQASSIFIARGKLVDLVNMGVGVVKEEDLSRIIEGSRKKAPINAEIPSDFQTRISAVTTSTEALELYNTFLSENPTYAENMKNDLMVATVGNRLLEIQDVGLMKAYISYLYADKARNDTMLVRYVKKEYQDTTTELYKSIHIGENY